MNFSMCILLQSHKFCLQYYFISTRPLCILGFILLDENLTWLYNMTLIILDVVHKGEFSVSLAFYFCMDDAFVIHHNYALERKLPVASICFDLCEVVFEFSYCSLFLWCLLTFSFLTFILQVFDSELLQCVLFSGYLVKATIYFTFLYRYLRQCITHLCMFFLFWFYAFSLFVGYLSVIFYFR